MHRASETVCPPTPPPPRLQGSSLLADPHLLVVRSRLSLHVSVIMLETVVLQVGKAEQLRGENEKVTTHSWGLHFETVNTRQPTNDDGTVSSLIIPLRFHCIIWKLVRRSRRCWILGLFVTGTADNGHHLKVFGSSQAWRTWRPSPAPPAGSSFHRRRCSPGPAGGMEGSLRSRSTRAANTMRIYKYEEEELICYKLPFFFIIWTFKAKYDGD